MVYYGEASRLLPSSKDLQDSSMYGWHYVVSVRRKCATSYYSQMCTILTNLQKNFTQFNYICVAFFYLQKYVTVL